MCQDLFLIFVVIILMEPVMNIFTLLQCVGINEMTGIVSSSALFYSSPYLLCSCSCNNSLTHVFSQVTVELYEVHTSDVKN